MKLPYTVVYIDHAPTDKGFAEFLNQQWKEGWEYITHLDSVLWSKRAIEWGGDTDTVLALAWGIASARIHEDLPAWLETGLESGTYGRDYLKTLGTKLMEKYA